LLIDTKAKLEIFYTLESLSEALEATASISFKGYGAEAKLNFLMEKNLKKEKSEVIFMAYFFKSVGCS
jgi:hypothetical protein